MKKIPFFCFVFVVIIFSFVSCRQNTNQELVDMLEQWMGKEIVISNTNQSISKLGDTIKQDSSNGYTVIHCIDSVGCTSCNLKLNLWMTFINDINKVSKQRVSLVFVSNSSSFDLKKIIKPSDKFAVVNISNDSVCLLHELFDNKYFNTILLDGNNKVITVGNPILTPKIMSNYYRAVMY